MRFIYSTCMAVFKSQTPVLLLAFLRRPEAKDPFHCTHHNTNRHLAQKAKGDLSSKYDTHRCTHRRV